ncbi:MAG: ABC transporter permease [Thermoprotei archaeon]
MRIVDFLKKLVGFRNPDELEAASSASLQKKYSSAWYSLLHTKEGLAGVALISVFLTWSFVEGLLQLVGLFIGRPSVGWVLLPHDPIVAPNPSASLLPPSPRYPFGTNFSGQDILSRLLYAAPLDAAAAVVVVSSAVIIGALLGMTAGYFGGWMDEALMRLTDAFLAFPAIILAIAISMLMGNGFNSLLISLCVVWWPAYARLFRGETLTIRYRGFVEVSKLYGLNDAKILFKHVFMNAIDPVLAFVALDFGGVILTYSSLAFLGIGIQPPYPEWGSMASNSLNFFPTAWWYTFFPSLAILMVVIGFVFVGDSLQEQLLGGGIL